MHKGDFESMNFKDIAEMINGNINAITYMTRFVLKSIKDSPIKSAIINVGSGTAAKVKTSGNFSLTKYEVYQSTQNYQNVLMTSLQ